MPRGIVAAAYQVVQGDVEEVGEGAQSPVVRFPYPLRIHLHSACSYTQTCSQEGVCDARLIFQRFKARRKNIFSNFHEAS